MAHLYNANLRDLGLREGGGASNGSMGNIELQWKRYINLRFYEFNKSFVS
jgi:hypothetical protein